MEIVNRINEIMRVQGLSGLEFAKKIGFGKSSVNNYLRGQNKMSVDFISRILDAFPDLSAEWLLRGKGDMFLLPELPKEEEKPNTDMGMAYFEQLMERMKKEMKEEIIAELKNIG